LPIRQGEAEARLDRLHLADRPLVQERQHGAGLGLKVVRIGLEEHDMAQPRRVEHGLRLPESQCEWLFAQHVLAALGRLDRPLGMQAVGQRQIDGLDVGIGQQLRAAAVVAVDAVGLRKVRGSIRVAAGHRDAANQRARRHIARELSGDVGAAEDADAQRGTQRSIHVQSKSSRAVRLAMVEQPRIDVQPDVFPRASCGALRRSLRMNRLAITASSSRTRRTFWPWC